jgi:hypothetical protein
MARELIKKAYVNPPSKEVSADWRTEDVVKFTRLETAQHPSELTQVLEDLKLRMGHISVRLFPFLILNS